MPTEKWTCEEDILCGVNQPKDLSNLSDLEKKHMPVITAPAKAAKDEEFEVKIEVGKLLAHPNEPVHFIEWVELYSGDTFLGEAYFSGGTSAPVAIFRIKLSHSHGPLIAWAKCNIHGLWKASKDIAIQ